MTLHDRQQGGMNGQAFGDAIGLYTEFTTRDEAQEMIDGKPLDMSATYPKKFIKGYNWSHIKRFIKNGWTDDTDQALSLLRSLYRSIKLEKSTEPENRSFTAIFAEELMSWRKGGLKSKGSFIGRSDPYCMGLGALVASVLKHPIF